MKRSLAAISLAVVITSCNSATDSASQPETTPVDKLTGTWRLIDGTIIEKGDTTITDYTKNLSCIKIITPTHFAFFQHDLRKGADSATFVSGGGKISLSDSVYTEHLEYCNAREWEGNDFSFTMKFSGDTLIQQGVEKIESAGIDRLNIERYVKAK